MARLEIGTHGLNVKATVHMAADRAFAVAQIPDPRVAGPTATKLQLESQKRVFQQIALQLQSHIQSQLQQ